MTLVIDDVRQYAQLRGIDPSDSRLIAKVVVDAAQYYFMPKANDPSQCRLARRHAKYLIRAIAAKHESPAWFKGAIKCAQK